MNRLREDCGLNQSELSELNSMFDYDTFSLLSSINVKYIIFISIVLIIMLSYIIHCFIKILLVLEKELI